MPLRALIFDVDGTLAETEELHREAFNETFAQEGLDWHWDQVAYKRLLGVADGRERLCFFRDEQGACHLTDHDMVRIHQRKTDRFSCSLALGKVRARPGVKSLIDEGRRAGLALAVATVTHRVNVTALCQGCWQSEADELFDVLVSAEDVKAKKPAPDVYLTALDRLGLQAQECLVPEDSLIGLQAARQAGLPVLITPSLYTRGDDFGAANWVCDDLTRPDWSLAELKKHYRRVNGL